MYVKHAHTNSTTNTPHHLTTTCTVHAHRLESVAELLEFAARLSKISGKFKLRSCGNLSVELQYVSINSSKLFGKVKIVDLKKKIYQRRPQDSKKQFLRYQCREQCNVCKKLKAVFLDAFSGCHCPWGTLQWHHVRSPKLGRHTGTRIAHYNGTLPWHPAMAPRPLPQTLSQP